MTTTMPDQIKGLRERFAKMREPEQLSLLPKSPPVGEYKVIPIDDLPANSELVGPPPSQELLDSIEAFGLIEAIVVAPVGKSYSVIAGRRRLQSCRHHKHSTIQVRIFTGMSRESILALVLSEQSSHRDNTAADLQAIEALIEAGSTEKDIAASAGMSIQTIRQRLRLRQLVPALFDAFMEGKIGISVSESAAKLPIPFQSELAEKYAKDGKLTTKDVNDARKVKVQEGVTVLPWGEMNDMPTVADIRAARSIGDKINDLFGGAVESSEEQQGSRAWMVKMDGKKYRVKLEEVQ